MCDLLYSVFIMLYFGIIIIILEAASEPKTHCNYRREAEMHPCLLKVKARIVVITGRRKSTFYVGLRLIRPAHCPGVPVVAIGKVGMPSVSGGYSAADTFSDDRIDAI